MVWKCRYCCGGKTCSDPKCNGLAVWSCFGYFHACTPCHSYKQLQELMDFSKPQPYPNKKPLEEYNQVSGGVGGEKDWQRRHPESLSEMVASRHESVITVDTWRGSLFGNFHS